MEIPAGDSPANHRVEREPRYVAPCDAEPICVARCLDGSPKDCTRLLDVVATRCAALEDRESDGVCATTAVEAGELTEEGEQAKRLFDAERWAQAVLALRRVVDGETGDDAGNRQLAEVALAIALDHTGARVESRERLGAILRHRLHLGHERARAFVDRGAPPSK